MELFITSMKSKITLNSRIKKEILKGINRIYYFFQANFLRIKYFKFQKKVNNCLNISLLCPTKNRSIKFERMANSFIKNTKNPNKVELLICFDLVEEEIDSYNDTILKLSSKGFKVKKYFRNLKSHAHRNNFLASQSNNEIIFPINDDLVMISNGWDQIINNEFSKIPLYRPFCIWINCDRKYKFLDYSAFPVINLAWYKCLGYIVPESFIFWYLDWWICEVSRMSKKYFLSSVKIHQFHADTYLNEVDKTHIKNSTEKNLKNDLINWLNTKEKRIKDSFKILSKY